jgi:hypothetical protein
MFGNLLNASSVARRRTVNDDLLSELEAELRGEILLGRGARTRERFYLSLEDLKETSVHIIGAAGFGKSFYLRHLIDQFLLYRQPFGLLDPHSELYEYALWRLRRSGVRPDRIVLLDPGDERYALGFNPLSCGLSDPGETASMVLEAFLKAWGAKDFDSTPRLEGVLRGMFRLLIESKLTLLEGYDFLNVDNASFRRALRERVSDRMVRQDWEEFEKLGKPDKRTLVESSRNRLRRVLQAAPVQMMLAQTQNTLNLRDVLDDGKFLLANLGNVSAPETQRLIGALLVNGIFHAAKLRDSRRRNDWFLICDEFGEFATRDFANSLDQLRKFGVHMVLAHQRLRQLEREDAEVLSAVMTNAKIKVVFGGLERPEAERMGRELFTGDVRGGRLKHVAYQTKFRPVLDTFNVESKSWSDSEGDSDTDSWSRGTGSGLSEMDGESLPDGNQESATRSRSRTVQSSSSSGESGARGHSTSHSSGGSSSLVPITRHEEFQEETSRQFWSLDEEWEQHVALVHGLAKREALIKVYNRPVIHVVTPEIEPERCDERLEQFQLKVMEQCPYVQPVETITVQIEDRRKEIRALVEKTETGDRPFKVESFRE